MKSAELGPLSPTADHTEITDAHLPEVRRLQVWLLVALALCGVGYVDYATGFEISFFVFYFIPIGYAAWRLGLLAGLILAVCSAIVWAIVDSCSGHVYSQPVYEMWSAAVRLIAFSTIAWLAARNSALLAAERIVSARLRQTLAEVRLLQGLLPVCAWCKRIRDEEGQWEQLEKYIQRKTPAKFSHGICPDCAARLAREAKLGPPPSPP